MADTGDVAERRLGYRPALDGLRALAVSAVLADHFWHRLLPGGGVGVSLFFVLSGFLITTLLVEEHGGAGTISVRAFYVRRARRLLPALGALLLVAVAGETLVGGRPLSAIPTATYLANWAQIGGHGLGPLNHTWSLSIEEQFYVVWPVALLALLSIFDRRDIFWICAIFAGLAAVWRADLFMHGASVARIQMGSDSRSGDLLIGAALGLAWSLDWVERISVRASRQAAIVGAAVLLAGGRMMFGERAQALWALTLIAVASAAVIVASLRSAPAWLTWRPLVAVGKVSYGLYLWHYPIGWALARFGLPGWAELAVGTVLAGLVTAASWTLIERRFTRAAPRHRLTAHTSITNDPNVGPPAITIEPAPSW